MGAVWVGRGNYLIHRLTRSVRSNSLETPLLLLPPPTARYGANAATLHAQEAVRHAPRRPGPRLADTAWTGMGVQRAVGPKRECYGPNCSAQAAWLKRALKCPLEVSKCAPLGGRANEAGGRSKPS